MNKTELIALAAEKAGVPKKDAERVISAALELISDSLEQGEKVQLSGFGAFEVKLREARIARNPHTNEPMTVPPTRVPAFKPSERLKKLVGKELE